MSMKYMPMQYISLSSLSANQQYKATITDIKLYESLIVNNNKFKKNNLLKIILIKTNLGSQPINLHYHTSQRYDFVIRDCTGKELWQWSTNKSFAQVAEDIILNPTDSKAYSEIVTFPNEFQPGFYTIEGWNAAQELKEIKLSIPITIIP